MDNLFLKGPEVTHLVLKARRISESGKAFSDIVDNQGNYYVDLVQQGGGVLGIALTGYTYILEQAGIRFFSLAGTSSGAIHALLMAGLAPVGESVSVKILNILSEKNIFDFVDGPRAIRKFLQRRVEGKEGLARGLFWNARLIYSLFKNKLGLNRGQALEDWLAGKLKENGVVSYGELLQLRKKLPNLYNRLTGELIHPEAKICVIASDITTHTRVELPRMASLYWKDVAATCPAKFVHASMAIPFLFQPFEKDDIPHAGEMAGEAWNKLAKYSGRIPKKVRFVDGGLLSNFPINVFHGHKVPMKPTFGARLSTFRKHYADTDSFFQFGNAIFETMRQIHDYEVILKHPDYRQLICNIDADKDYNWLNFKMPREKQRELFILGAKKALAFLDDFNWEHYKETRQKLLSI